MSTFEASYQIIALSLFVSLVFITHHRVVVRSYINVYYYVVFPNKEFLRLFIIYLHTTTMTATHTG